MRWDKVFWWCDRLFQYPGGFLACRLPCLLSFAAERKRWTMSRPPPLVALIACSSLLFLYIHISLLPLPLLLRLNAMWDMTLPMPPTVHAITLLLNIFISPVTALQQMPMPATLLSNVPPVDCCFFLMSIVRHRGLIDVDVASTAVFDCCSHWHHLLSSVANADVVSTVVIGLIVGWYSNPC